MSASKEPKEVNMNKARAISFVVTLSVLVASSSGFARAGSNGSERSRPVSSRAPAQRFHADLTGGSRTLARLGSWAASSPSFSR